MRISTIIHAYNRADLIGETLRSVLEQSRPPAEVIVVDDDSTDGTADAVAAYGKAVTLLRQAQAGPATARNTGFAAASGEIVHFMDSDDLCSLNTYELHGAAIERGAEMVHGPWVKSRINGRAVCAQECVLQQRPLPGRFVAADLVLLTHWATVLQACLFRREVIEGAGPFRAELNPSDDLEMLYRILRLRPRIHPVAGTLVLYRFHPEPQLTGADSPGAAPTGSG
ncbi:MAG: glycosyltransferase [Novosphingobium sp.]|nr:glycosyltransferase [Novosphingobium sp.]